MAQHVVIVRHVVQHGPSAGDTSWQTFGPFTRSADAWTAADVLEAQYASTPMHYDGHPCETYTEVTTLTAWKR